jgi:RNA polymerase sigma factor (TIGR02999 family)
MRQILVDHARARGAGKRGGGRLVTLHEDSGVTDGQDVDVLALDEAVAALAAIDPRAARIVELRFFAGLTEDEIAGVLGVAAVTVKRDWRAARAFLCDRLGGGPAAHSGTA